MTKKSHEINKPIKIVDLFCGIGGFRLAFEQAASEYGINCKTIFASDNEKACAKAYTENFGDIPAGDIKKIPADDIPDHDVLLAGFPCQPFSIIGTGQGFLDEVQGTLFFDIARILEVKKPRAFVLENVKRLVSHNKGNTLNTIMNVLKNLGYTADFRVFNALDFGLPQKRERVFIVGFLGPWLYSWPEAKKTMKPLTEILEPDENVPQKFWASEYIRNKRHAMHKSNYYPAIWHENKAGNISSYPYSCALRANASYNYLLVNGERRLTPREMLRLQGFPESFKIVCTDEQTKNQAGNTIPIPVAKEVIMPLIKCFKLHGLQKKAIVSERRLEVGKKKKAKA